MRLLHARALRKSGHLEEAAEFYRSAVEDDPSLADEVLAAELNVEAEPEPEESPERVRVPAEEFGETDVPVEMERPNCNFADVGGMEAVKEAIRMKIIHPLNNKELFEAYGKKIGGGVLLYGPPGCGKTLLARATAGEIRAKFIPIGLHDVLDMWLGQSEKRLHDIFEQARRTAPCVLFFDEADALAASRSDMRHSAGRHIINQFLSELDGVDAQNEGVLVLAATNAPWHLDDAFRRPGRFDRIIFVPPPDEPARTAIWEMHLKGKPAEAIDYRKLAAKSDGFSGADIRAAVEAGIEAALSLAMKKGRPIPLSTKMLLKAAASVRPSTTEWFGTAKNYATYANASGVYDDILEHLGKKRRP